MKFVTNACTAAYSKTAAALTTFTRDERGVTAIEYSLIGVAVAVILVYAFNGDSGAISGPLKTLFSTIATKVSTASTATFSGIS
ncbi:Flp family type IVb pilin [Dongshaea marina]|uniref:Flp family type IVb pilin n=1 Tax=Dongshaea marina TaxID=2047966 RepID=UPI000D3E9C07|nr:Flp family type IVb pilin [Dongshaea marina]